MNLKFHNLTSNCLIKLKIGEITDLVLIYIRTKFKSHRWVSSSDMNF